MHVGTHDIGPFLAGHERARARAVAARAAGTLALVGAAATAVALFAERAGADLPLFDLPFREGVATPGLRIFAWLAISLAGLWQGALLLAAVLAAAAVVRVAGAPFLRRPPARTASDLGARTGTDGFSAALEAEGPLAPMVTAFALATRVPPRALAGPRPSRWKRRLTCAAILAVALVALMPGTAPGGEGPAPVGGASAPGERDLPLTLRLIGPGQVFLPHEPVPIVVVGEAAEPPDAPRTLPIALEIDGGTPRDTGRALTMGASDGAGLNLREFARDLASGEHRAVALAGGARSNEYRFRIAEPPGAANPPPPPPRPPPPSPGQGGGGAAPTPKFVEPLVREGPTVEKNARVPIEVPGGAATEERTVEQAWPELQRRLEAALDRPGLSPSSRALVREYFERLRPR